MKIMEQNIENEKKAAEMKRNQQKIENEKKAAEVKRKEQEIENEKKAAEKVHAATILLLLFFPPSPSLSLFENLYMFNIGTIQASRRQSQSIDSRETKFNQLGEGRSSYRSTSMIRYKYYLSLSLLGHFVCMHTNRK
jgi:hypothetical protein